MTDASFNITITRGNHQFNDWDIHCRMESVTNGIMRDIHDL